MNLNREKRKTLMEDFLADCGNNQTEEVIL